MKIKTIFLFFLIMVNFESRIFAYSTLCSFFALSNVGTLAISTAAFLASYYINKNNIKPHSRNQTNLSEETQLLVLQNLKYDKYSNYSLCCGFITLAIATSQFFGYMIVC